MTPDHTRRAVVIVSGGAAVSPFTTPDSACAEGLPAGNTDTFLREGLLRAGFEVYTSPAGVGVGQVVQDTGWGGFCDGPPALPAEMTVNAVGGIDDAGRNLARFLTYLSETYGVGAFDLVAHSMGGLFSRAAIRTLKDEGSPLRVRTLTTIGTPWEGGFTADYAAGDLGIEACLGDPVCEKAMGQFGVLVGQASQGAAEQVTARYLTGPGGWNEGQGDALAGIPVLLIAGDYLTREGGGPEVWPHDGLVAVRSGTAQRVSERVLPSRYVRIFPDVHSIYFSDQLGLPWERALTWDPDVLTAVIETIQRPEPALVAHGIDQGAAMPSEERCAAGDWVEVERVLAEPADRAANLPADTAAMPLLQWVKGFALTERAIGDDLTVKTMTGRLVRGRLAAVNPGYFHTFGKPIPALWHVGADLRERLAAYRAAEGGEPR